jgi:hypothetical protein
MSLATRRKGDGTLGSGSSAMLGSRTFDDAAWIRGALESANNEGENVAAKVDYGRIAITAVPASPVPDVEAEQWKRKDENGQGPKKILSLEDFDCKPDVPDEHDKQSNDAQSIHG